MCSRSGKLSCELRVACVMNSWAGPCASSPCNTCGSASHHTACVADTPSVHSHSRAWSRHQVPCRCCLLPPVSPHAVAEPSRTCGLAARARPTSSASSTLHCSMPPLPACLGSSCSNCCVATARPGRCQLGRTKARRCRRRPRRLSRTSFTAESALAVETFISGTIEPDGKRVPCAAPLHPERLTVYEEALEVCMLRLASDEVVDQMKHYWLKGYPILAPPVLVDGTWHVRDLRAPESSQIGCAWRQEFLSWNTVRDQLSFNFALWEANLTAHWFAASSSIKMVEVKPHSSGREPIRQATRCKELLELTPFLGCMTNRDI